MYKANRKVNNLAYLLHFNELIFYWFVHILYQLWMCIFTSCLVCTSVESCR